MKKRKVWDFYRFITRVAAHLNLTFFQTFKILVFALEMDEEMGQAFMNNVFSVLHLKCSNWWRNFDYLPTRIHINSSSCIVISTYCSLAIPKSYSWLRHQFDFKVKRNPKWLLSFYIDGFYEYTISVSSLHYYFHKKKIIWELHVFHKISHNIVLVSFNVL